MTPRRLLAPLVLVAALLTPAAAAHATTLTSTAYGALDFGDGVAYRVTGAHCESASVDVHVVAGPSGRELDGPSSKPLRSPRGGCDGIARVPTWRQVSATGWQQGDSLSLDLQSKTGSVPLRFAQIQVADEPVAAGSPQSVAADDPDYASSTRALTMSTGDAVALGRVDLRHVDSIALRVCIVGVANPLLPGGVSGIVPPRVEPPVYVSLREESEDGTALVGPTDIANDETNPGRLEQLGFNGCYRLVVLPLSQTADQDAPPLFLRVDAAIPGVLKVNSVDIDGTAAATEQPKQPHVRGLRTVFNGTSFKGFTETGCALRNRAATNLRTGGPTQITACSLTYDKSLENIVLRFQVRSQNFYDNAGIFFGSQEIQMREAGEYLPGGYVGDLAAQWEKLGTYPQWTDVEIVQLGARFVISLNGRTVTDLMRPGGAPPRYKLEFLTQPFWSARLGGEVGYGDETSGSLTLPSEWGAYSFRDIQLRQCTSATDRVCMAAANAERGEVPVPAGAPKAN